MWRYLKAAFWSRPRIAGLGDVPVIALSAAAFAIAGVAFPPLWLLGIGVVGGLTFALSTSERFRKTVVAADLKRNGQSSTAQVQNLMAGLDAESRRQLAGVRGKAAAVLSLYQQQSADEIVMKTTRDALGKLEWLYLRMLLQKQRLLTTETASDAKRVRADLVDIERELTSDKLMATMRQSREATAELLRKRLSVAEQREHALSEIDSDLQRIETQIDLAMDEASLAGKPVAVSAKIELASQMLDARMFGTMAGAVIDLDEAVQRERSEPE